MIKKFFSLLLTLCMVLAMMPVVTKPVTVQAASTHVETVRIGGRVYEGGSTGVELNSTKKYYHNGEGGGLGTANDNPTGADATFDADTGTLTLNGLNINTNDAGIWWKYNDSGAHNLKIVLEDGTTNTINNSYGSGILGEYGYRNDGPSLTIQGGGTLNVTGYTSGIWVWHNITIQGGATVNATGKMNMGICNNDSEGKITIKDQAVVSATGVTYGTYGTYGIGYGNEDNNFNVPVIQGGTVTMTGATAAVRVEEGFVGTSPDLSGYIGGCIVTVGDAAEGSTEWNNENSLQSYKYIKITPGTHTHNWSSSWSSDATHHWHECEKPGCDININSGIPSYAEHQYSNANDVDCNTCGYNRILCSHSLATKIDGQAAACTSPGWKEYYQCATCNKFFKEQTCTTLIADIGVWQSGEGAISALGHDWTYSADGATLTASCSRKTTCHVDDKTLTLTANTVEHNGSTYDGASIPDASAWTTAELTTPTIKYEGTDGTNYSSSETAPTVAGRYKATITVGGATAAAPFAITGDPHTLKVESGENGIAGIETTAVTESSIRCYADVTLAVTPDTGYRLKRWVVSGPSITITNNKFIMPDCDVTVTAEFEKTSGESSGGGVYIPSQEPSTDTQPENTKTDTTTLPDGTKVETSTTTDKTTGATIVEEKKTALDGTVTEMKTTTQKDGSSETTSLETRTDGSTTETNTTVDTEGTAQSVVRDKDFPTGDLLTIRKTEEPSGEVSYVLATLVTEEATIVKAKVERAEALANMKNIPYRVKVLDENGKLDYKVRVNTGDVKANQTLYVYKYDSKTKSFGLVQADYQKVKADEKANIICDFENLISTQRYQLVTKSKAGLLDKKILATVKAKIGQKSLKVNQSTSFKLDEKLNLENVSTIKYSTSDKQVVKVSKAGKITGKNTGTADIKATITLINGKTKTVRMKIKVK